MWLFFDFFAKFGYFKHIKHIKHIKLSNPTDLNFSLLFSIVIKRMFSSFRVIFVLEINIIKEKTCVVYHFYLFVKMLKDVKVGRFSIIKGGKVVNLSLTKKESSVKIFTSGETY